jgi:RNA polymerase subunit RPABC4/transcription elongation factor Spt4
VTCVKCTDTIPDDAKFCPLCGERQPEEDPGAVAEYQTALESLADRTEAWAMAELETLRRELRVRESTHQRLMAERRAGPAQQAPVSMWVDAKPFQEFRAGEQCLLRLRVINDTGRPLASVELALDVTAATAPLVSRTDRALGPAEEHVFSMLFRPGVAGHHHASGQVVLRPLRGAEQRWQLSQIPFLVGAAAALQQQIHIDARAQRVGVFENIGVASRGGLLDETDWRLVDLRPAIEGAPVAVAAPKGLAPGHSGTARVVLHGDVVDVELEGHRGSLVDWHDPALRMVVRPGDKLQVVVIGADGAGRPLFSSRGGAVQPAMPAGQIRVGPEDDLAAALRNASPGAKILIEGTHRGPFVLDRPLELAGGKGAVLESRTGPALRISGDVVLRELTVRGAAPNGQYAIDAIEVRSGRVIVQECTLSSDAPGNVVPGRAIAVAGAATVEVRHCVVQGSGVGVSVDVSWSGFATDTARGARVKVISCEISGCGTGVAVAGNDREVRVARTRFIGVSEAAVRVLKGGMAAIEECTIPPHLLVAEPGANLVTGIGGGR